MEGSCSSTRAISPWLRRRGIMCCYGGIRVQICCENRFQRSPKNWSRSDLNGRVLFIDPRDIAVVEAEGNYVLLRRDTGTDLLRESISEIAEKLEPFRSQWKGPVHRPARYRRG